MYIDGTNLVQTFDVLATFATDNTYKDIVITGDTVILNPTKCFTETKTYHIEADFEAVIGSCNAKSLAISDNTDLEFTTTVIVAPTPAITTPTDNVNDNGVLMDFDEDIDRGSGSAYLYDANDNLIETISADDDRVDIT